MMRVFLQTAQRISGKALGVTGLLLGVFSVPAQGITLRKGVQKDVDDNVLMIAQGPLSNEILDIRVSLLPSINDRQPIGPSVSEVQLLHDLFLPQYPSFNSQLLDQQLILYSIHLFLAGPPDVLIVGSSRALQGVEPKTLQQALMAQGHPKLDIYNFSINGATAQVIDLLLREILAPDQLPQLVIWADGSRAFNSGRPDRTYIQISQSDGFKQIENGVYPILVRPAEMIAQSTCQDYLDPRFSHRSLDSISAGFSPFFTLAPDTHTFLQAGLFPVGHQKLVPKSYSIAMDETCTTDSSASIFGAKAAAGASPVGSSNAFPGTRVSEQVPNSEMVVHSSPLFDYSIFSLEPLASHLSLELEINGFFPNSTEFEPTSYYQRFPYVAGEYDANYVPFQLSGVQTEATQRLAQAMREQQIPLVFVNLPLTQDYLDSTRSTYESQFLQHMQNMARQAGFILVDLNQVDLAQNQYFADPSHLNEQGARAVARELATQSGVLWPR